jgi:hypothetical protein
MKDGRLGVLWVRDGKNERVVSLGDERERENDHTSTLF